MTKPISEYTRKRNFTLTSEPAEEDVSTNRKQRSAHALQFVIQKHDARRLHYDFRLEMGGTLKSWAVPKGPSLDPQDKRLAVHVEDHPLAYASFEGSIPQGQYGGGDVIVWDQGIWQPLDDPEAAYKKGKLKFALIGEKLTGYWNLVRTHLRGSGDKEQWLLIKERDDSARPSDEYDIVKEQPQSVLSGKLPSEKIKKQKENQNHKEKENKVEKELEKEKINDNKRKRTAKSLSVAATKSSEKVAMPKFISPELATLVKAPPAGDWLYEIKFDGYRILARIENGEVRLFTRTGNDWTDRLPLQAKALASLNLTDSWLDGEVVVFNDKAVPDFQKLQSAFDIGRSHNILYYIFDAPYLNGRDLREEPVEVRRAEVENVLSAIKTKNSLLHFSAAFTANHQDIIASACAMSLEGVIGKRLGSPYVSRRSGDWIKLKCRQRQEFVIVGFTKPQGGRSHFGALLLAVHEQAGEPSLRYAGRVGTGFNGTSLNQLYEKMAGLSINQSPLSHSLPSGQERGVQWVKPELVCEVEFAEWTSDKVLRQASFIALRSDKPASEIIHEQATPVSELTTLQENANQSIKPRTKTAKDSDSDKTRIAITHPERVIDPDSGTTKKDLAVFYGDISQWILPHLKNRPVSLLRAPKGITEQQFFQKHTEQLQIPDIKQLNPALDPGHAALMEINSPQALLGAVQMGTIELHTWGSQSDKIEFPDRIVLDLDPDPALPWRSMLEATRLLLAVLDELKLKAYLKTTGGKGMHIVIPLAPVASWDYIKDFSKAISQFMARQIPQRFVAKMGPQNRVGRIFVDYLRNSRGASTVAAYSVRARPGLPVSVPITREEFLKISGSAQWTIGNLDQRLGKLKTDPWDGYNHRQRISNVMWRKLGVTPSHSESGN